MTRLFGEVAIEKGYLRPEQLQTALTEQERIDKEEGGNRFLGEVLIEMGYMTEKQVLDVLNAVHVRTVT